jgi:hypothetical protein
MPGPFVHLLVQQRLASQLRSVPGGRGFADILDARVCSPYAAFGSIGPDFLFFSLREYGNILSDLTRYIFQAYDALEPLIAFYEEHIEPIKNEVDDAIRRLDEALFQGLFTRLRSITDLLLNTALTAIGEAITDRIDFFYNFYPRVQAGYPEDQWYWFDTLHYRRTGRFASELWRLAGSDIELQRYALGYVSHIGTDVVGHPFVNAITGGPYRTHWHRHKLVENWIDAYARRHYSDQNRVHGCLRLSERDRYAPDSISASYYYRLVEFPGGRMPPELAQLLATALANTFRDIAHPPDLSPSDFDDTYRLWLKWFKRATSAKDSPAPQPPPRVFGEATRRLIDDYVSNLPGSPTGPPAGTGIENILQALVAFAAWIIQVVAYTCEWVATNGDRILALPHDEALTLSNWFLYEIQKGVFEVYDKLRFALVLGAYVFPEARDFSKQNPSWGKAFTNTSDVTQIPGSGSPYDSQRTRPIRQEQHNLTTIEHHLVYPAQAVPSELLGAHVMPPHFYGADPHVFITTEDANDATVREYYNCRQPYGQDGSATEWISDQNLATTHLGTAVGFTSRLIVEFFDGPGRADDLPNFNLDGDRGYAWKAWRAQQPDIESIAPTQPVNTDYVDP